MDQKASDLMSYYHAIVMQLRSRYQADNSLQLEDLLEQYQHLKAYKRLKKRASKDDLEMIDRFLYHDIRALVHNRDSTALDESPILLMLKDALWEALYQSADQVQLSYFEMNHDIKQEGQYREGECVVHGLVECSHCGLIRQYVHMHKLEACERCGSTYFERPRHFPRKIDLKSNHRY